MKTEINPSKKKQVKYRLEKNNAVEQRICDMFSEHRKEKTSMNLEDLAIELGTKQGSSAMRIEKGTFGLSISRFLQLCDIYKIDPIKALKEQLK